MSSQLTELLWRLCLMNNLLIELSCVPQRQHSRNHVYWTEEFDMNDVTQSEDEIKEALKYILTISMLIFYSSAN